LLDNLTSNQISEWEAYDRLDPIGEWRGDFQLAYISSLITNVAISVHGKKGAKLTQPQDFMLEWGKEKEEVQKQSTDQIKEFMMSFAKEQNKKVQLEKGKSRPPVKKNKPPKREKR